MLVAPEIGEPFRRHWLLPLLESSVTRSPAQNVVGPFAVIVGAAGVGFKVTFVVPAAEVQAFTVTVTEYVPASAAVTFARVGFCNEEVKPFGPVHFQVALLTNDVKREIVPPTQY